MRPFNLTNSTVNVVGYFNRISKYNLNRGALAVVPVRYGTSTSDVMTPAPTTTAGSSKVSGSSITCKMLTTGDYPAADLTDNLREREDFSFTSNPFSSSDNVKKNLTRGVGSNANAVITIGEGNTFKVGTL